LWILDGKFICPASSIPEFDADIKLALLALKDNLARTIF
jgi:hypothetical protein